MGNGDIGDRRRAKMLAMENRPVVRHARFENHMVTEGLLEGAAKGENPATTHVELPVNLTLLIGGLSRVRSLSEEQRHAAARYRTLYEGSMIGAAGAIDYTQPRVDVSGKATNPADGGIDARRRYADAVQVLGLTRSGLFEQVVCHDMSVRELARRLGEGCGDQARQRAKGVLVEALDTLVDHFGLIVKPGRPKVRRDGAVAVDWSLPVSDIDGDDSAR